VGFTVTDEEITDLLFVRQDPVPAQLAMVFAAANEEDLARRTRRGVQLYQAGYVPKLLVTGGGVLRHACPEAKRMAEIARDEGVVESDLLVEDQSGNTFHNAFYSRALLQARGLLAQLRVVILVSSEWHMRRVLLTVKKSFPEEVKLVCCPTLEGCTRERWTTSKACRELVEAELLLLEAFLETGAI
jgi:vancomycin permeability regulator SanA